MEERLILASASPRRRMLLAQVGLEPEIVISQVKEEITMDAPDQAVIELSRQKAQAVALTIEGAAVVIGADTVVVLDGDILGKPGDEKEAAQMIRRLQGRFHQVYTGVTIVNTRESGSVSFAECTKVVVYPMTEEEIQAYCDTGEPMDKAGAYGIQGRFAAFIAGIEGDYNNVVGLPVGRVYQELKKMRR